MRSPARENVARLSSHPSLMIWNGCNENIWAYRDWGWKDHEEVQREQRKPGGGTVRKRQRNGGDQQV